MKTLIAFATRHGTTREYAETLARMMPGHVSLVDLSQQPTPDLAGYDAVIIGSAIYYGQPLKVVKDFCAKRLADLRTKRLGLFVCCLIRDKADAALRSAFPAELCASAAALGMFGGKIEMARLGFGERLITSVLAKGGLDMSSYSEEPLAGFVKVLTGGEAVR